MPITCKLGVLFVVVTMASLMPILHGSQIFVAKQRQILQVSFINRRGRFSELTLWLRCDR